MKRRCKSDRIKNARMDYENEKYVTQLTKGLGLTRGQLLLWNANGPLVAVKFLGPVLAQGLQQRGMRTPRQVANRLWTEVTKATAGVARSYW